MHNVCTLHLNLYVYAKKNSIHVKCTITVQYSREGYSTVCMYCTFFSWLGMMQRTKWGVVCLKTFIRLLSCSLYSCPTVRNIPLRGLWPPNADFVSDWACCIPMPTTLAVSFQSVATNQSLELANNCTTLSLRGSMFFINHWSQEYSTYMYRTCTCTLYIARLLTFPA